MNSDKTVLLDSEYENRITRRIYYAETDAGGIVYYGNLCKYMEIGCAEWFRKYSLSLKELNRKYNMFFVMKEAYLNYYKPVLYDNEIVISTRMIKIWFYSIKFNTEIFVDNELRYRGESKMIPVDMVSKKPVRIPEEVLTVYLPDRHDSI